MALPIRPVPWPSVHGMDAASKESSFHRCIQGTFPVACRFSQCLRYCSTRALHSALLSKWSASSALLQTFINSHSSLSDRRKFTRISFRHGWAHGKRFPWHGLLKWLHFIEQCPTARDTTFQIFSADNPLRKISRSDNRRTVHSEL